MKKIIIGTLYFLTAALPLIFTSISYELFEFPKFITLFAGTIIISLAWIWSIFTKEMPHTSDEPTLASTRFIKLGVLSILATQIIATIFSIHPYTSFWGYYSRFHQGLLTTICYTIIYFAVIKWMDKNSTQKVINISINTSILISVIAILEHYNISITCTLMTLFDHLKNSSSPVYLTTVCWGVFTNPHDRSFATLGQPNWLAAYLIPNLTLLLYKVRTELAFGRKNTWKHTLSFVLLFAALIFTHSRSGILAFAITFVVYVFMSLRLSHARAYRRFTIYYSSVLLIIGLLLGTAYTPSIFKLISTKQAEITTPSPTENNGSTVLEQGGTESGDIRKIVWTGALRLIQHHPLLGTGPETFAYTYYWERPILHNYTSEWDFLYNKAHNEFLNFAATSGIVGLTAYLFWHLTVFFLGFKKPVSTKKSNKDRENEIYGLLPVASASIVGFAASNFFGFSVIPSYFLMTILAGLTTSIQTENIKVGQTTRKDLIVVGISSAILLVFFPIRLFLADYYFNLGKNTSSIPLLERAVALRPNEDLFHSYLSENYAAHADQDEYLDKALQQADFTRTHNPYHLNYYKSRAKVYITLAAIDSNYYVQAASELVRARQLAPSDPKLAYNLGLVYSRLGKIDEAEEQINQAIELKKDYQDAYYALTLIYEQTDAKDKIPGLLQNARMNLATYSGLLQQKMDVYLK